MTTYRNRRAVQLENENLRLTVLVEGGHLAELLHKPTGINPLWTPPWPSIEPSAYSAATHPEYGCDAESKLLAGLMGHNLCMDIFGGPSDDEAAAGMTVHGEASVASYDITVENGVLTPAGCACAGAVAFRAEHFFYRPHGGRHKGGGGESLRARPPHRMDAARHAGASLC